MFIILKQNINDESRIGLFKKMKGIKKDKLFKILFLLIILTVFYLYMKNFSTKTSLLYFNQINENYIDDYETVKENANLKNQEFYCQFNVSIKIPQYCEKFIILTTINAPTPNVKLISLN